MRGKTMNTVYSRTVEARNPTTRIGNDLRRDVCCMKHLLERQALKADNLHPGSFPAGMKIFTNELAYGLYHLSKPSWICFPASSGVIEPLMTPALTCQSSFSRFGSPRERI